MTVDLFFLTALIAAGIFSYFAFFKAKEKVFFLILASVFFLVSSLLVFSNQVTMAATTQPYVLQVSNFCNETNSSNVTCTFQNQVVAGTTVYENVSFPSPLEGFLAVILLLVGFTMGFKAITTPRQEIPRPGPRQHQEDELQ